MEHKGPYLFSQKLLGQHRELKKEVQAVVVDKQVASLFFELRRCRDDAPLPARFAGR